MSPIFVDGSERLFTEDGQFHKLLNFDLSTLSVWQLRTNFSHLGCCVV